MGICTITELIILNPSVLCDKSIHNLLHGQVWDELLLGQFLTCHRVKVTNPLWIESYTAGHQREVQLNSVSLKNRSWFQGLMFCPMGFFMITTLHYKPISVVQCCCFSEEAQRVKCRTCVVVCMKSAKH